MRTFVILLLMSSPAFAQLHGGDVELTTVDNKITTNQRVYAAEFGETIANEVNEPGFDSDAGTFPVGSSIGFSILDSLRKWDGTDFDTIPPETIGVSFLTSLGPISTPAVPSIVDGFDLNVSGDGAWHRHYNFVLNAPAASTEPPSTGVYLLQLQLDSSDPGLSPTDPFFIVFNQNDTELNHDAAIALVESSLTVPEPSSLLLAATAMCLGIRRRRRPLDTKLRPPAS